MRPYLRQLHPQAPGSAIASALAHDVASSMPGLQLVARSIITGTDALYRTKKYLFPGGDILVLLAPIWSRARRYQQGSGDQTSIDIWSIRDPTNPRRILRTRTRFGWVVDDVLLKETESSAVGRVVLACRLGGNGQGYALECYDIHIAEGDPAVPGMEPSYERIVRESRQLIPSLPERDPAHLLWDEDTGSVMSAHTLTGDVVACTLEDSDCPQGDYDESYGDYNFQHNPRFPLPGYQRIYLAHLSGTSGRWLHPRHTERFLSVKAYAHDGHLYLLARTASTYVVEDYRFSEDMLLSTTGNADADDYLSLGSPLAEYESGRLPDPRVPWGEFDSESVHFDPIHGFTILLLRHWIGEGQLLRLPLPDPDLEDGEYPSAPRPIVHAFGAPLLPDCHKFTEIWLGRDHAVIESESDFLGHPDHPADDFDYTLLSFKFAEDGRSAAHEPLSEASDALVVRRDLNIRRAGVAMPPFMQGDFAVDERSGRLCTTRPTQSDTESELFVFSLGLGPLP